MRTTNRTFVQPITRKEELVATSEEIFTINEHKGARTIEVSVAFKAADGSVLGYEHHHISGAHYDSLMSEAPVYAPGKPKNEYREIDLWYVIDLIRVD